MTVKLQKVPAPPIQSRFTQPQTATIHGSADHAQTASGISLPWIQYFQSQQASQSAALANIAAQAIQPFTQATLPTLSSSAAGTLIVVTDYNHLLQWNGTAFVWGPGENGSGYIQGFLSAPTGSGWHICDGSTVNRLNQDGTISSVVLPNYTTAAYLKLGNALSIGPNAPSGETDSVSAGTPAGTNAGNTSSVESADTDVQSGSGATVAAHTHTHTIAGQVFTGAPLAGHQHGPGTIDLENTVLLAYFRQ